MLYFKSMTAISGSIDIYGLNQIIHVTVKTGGFFFSPDLFSDGFFS